MNQKNTRDILTELYAIAPDLAEHEKEILPILEQMQAQKPVIKIDRLFQENLRDRLMGELSHRRDARSGTSYHLWFSRSWFTGFASAFSLAVVGIFVAFPLLGGLEQQGIQSSQENIQSQNMLATQAGSPRALLAKDTSPELDVYREYVYTGSLDEFLGESPAYKQLYPSTPPKIDGLDLYEYESPMGYFGIDLRPDLLKKEQFQLLKNDELIKKIQRAANPYSEPLDGQKIVQFSLSSPRKIYQRVSLPDNSGNGSFADYYIPAIVFQCRDCTSSIEGKIKEVVIPLVQLPQK